MIGSVLINLEKVDSSNVYLNKLLKEQVIEEGFTIVAREQTAGRGQINNKWESKSGENITLSFLLYPKFLPVEMQFILSKFVALGIYDALNELVENVKIKWPNDIYIDDKKVAGILIENTLRSATISNCIIGIGININQTEFSSSIPNPGSLKILTGKHYSLDLIIERLLMRLNYWYEKVYTGKFQDVDNAYHKTLYKLGEFCEYEDEKGRFIGKIIGIEPDGRLCLLDSNNHARKYAFKEVKFI
ncbi:MAG: biotin--[acetyl-CoA-carboxylase] ligase [Bacteroidales bacterium]|nr:biotin--[acetyl-CoA-carboxylase] ligase [Bacteroidales bacterium]